MGAIARLLSRLSGKDALARVAGRLARRVRNQYEALEYRRLRKEPEIKTDNSVTEQWFEGNRRIKAYALGDKALDNDSVGSVVNLAVRLTVGSHGGRPFFLGDGAAEWQEKWSSWAKVCGYAEDENWAEMLGMILRAVKVHGDCLILIDPELTGNRLRIWDADQICPLTDGDFHRWCNSMGYPSRGNERDLLWRQVEGSVVDPHGRVDGYFVTWRRNQCAVDLEDAVYLPRSLCRRVSYHFKISQYRGEPVVLANSDLTEDTRNLQKSAVAAAKNFAEMAIVMERPEVDSGVPAELTALPKKERDALIEASGLSETDVKKSYAGDIHTDLSALEGRTSVGWVDHGTIPHVIDPGNQPSANIRDWIATLQVLNGQRLGMISCLAKGTADNSYSSGMIELQISWSQFQEDQKLLERQVVDYAVSRICPGADYLVEWPKSFEIDPEKAEKTRDARIMGGRETFQEQVGPEWRKKVQALADFKRCCEENGLNPALFSWYGKTAAGNESSAAVRTPDGGDGTERNGGLAL